MSLFASFTKKNKLNDAIKAVAQARKAEGGQADVRYQQAYQGFADVLVDHPMLADALYNWGFGLLHQAKGKPANESEEIYEDAIAKFNFCLLVSPHYLGAAIDSGVAWMDLARIKNLPADHVYYDRALEQFERANGIQFGPACYNLACIYSMRGDYDACKTALEDARDKGSLPDAADMMNDPDLAKARSQAWFEAFLDTLKKRPAAEKPADTVPAETAAEAEVEAAPVPEPAAEADSAEAEVEETPKQG